MSAPRPGAPDGVHPLARPFLFVFKPGFARLFILALAALLLIGFGVEFAMTGGEGLSKYPEVLGGYEVLPFLAAAGAILAAWLVRWILGVAPDFYERAAGDVTETEKEPFDG
jgi:uncharacterized membrane protein